MKYLVVLIAFFLFFHIAAGAQGFRNSLRSVKGSITLLKELSNGEILAYFQDINLDSTRIVKLHSNGELAVSKTIAKLSDNLWFDKIYEYNNGYAFAYRMSKQNFAATNEPFSEGFMFFDSNLVFKYKTQFDIHDTTALRHQIYYDMSDDHVWFGMVHYTRPNNSKSFFLKVVRFNPDGSFRDSTSLRVDSLIEHHKFIRSFREDSVYRMMVGYNNQLHTYSFSSTLSLIRHDSTSGYQFVNNNDTYNTILGDSGYDDIVLAGDHYITTNLATGKQGKAQLSVSKWNGSTRKDILVPLPDPAHSFEFSFHYDRRISYSKNKVFVAANYTDPAIQYNYLEYVHQLDSGLNTVKTWPGFNNIQQGGIDALEATQDGSCLVIGTVWSPFSEITIYLAKLDSNGVLAFVKPIYKQSDEIVLYPNPCRNMLYGVPDQSTVHFVDITGRHISVRSDPNGTDISMLGSGIYFYRVHNQDGELLFSGKLLKE